MTGHLSPFDQAKVAIEEANRLVESIDTLRDIIELSKDKAILQSFDDAVRGQHGGNHGNQYTSGKSNNVTLATNSKSKTGNAPEAALRRLRKDRPDVHQRVIATVTPRVVAGADVWHLIVDSCPYCGKQHSHGGGPITGDWRRLLGHRVADCGGRGGYVLLEPQRTPHGKEATP